MTTALSAGTLLFSLLCLPVERPQHATASLRAILERLHLGHGAVVADVGAGGGAMSWQFAKLVGEKGRVYAEEIDQKKVDKLRQHPAEKGSAPVEAVLGRADDPCLPAGAIDLIFLRRVYHHFAKPRAMLRGMWTALKPGGYLVVVDRRRGTLRDWVPREKRARSHHWIAETTVVREAREEGFLFHGCAEDLWYEKEPFVVIFRRPPGEAPAGSDPDRFLPLRAIKLSAPAAPCKRIAVVALGAGRTLLPALCTPPIGAPGIEVRDIILEEWATQKDERPPLPDGMPEGVSVTATLTEQGDPHLGEVRLDAVYFLDTYHLLFHAKTLLSKLREAMAPGGVVHVLDRRAEEQLERRLASHRRRIHPDQVIAEMEAAGFQLRARLPDPAPDRFLMLFEPAPRTPVEKPVPRPRRLGRF